MTGALPDTKERDAGPRLPAAGDPGDERLADPAVRYWNIRSVVGGVIFLALCAGTVAIFRADWMFFWGPWVVAPLVVAGVLLDVLLMNRIEFQNFSFTVTEDYVYVTRGRWLRTSATIPTSQILNVATTQGPFLAAVGLVNVQFTCLLDVDGIGPITQDAADRIRRTVLDQPVDDQPVHDQPVDGGPADDRPAG